MKSPSYNCRYEEVETDIIEYLALVFPEMAESLKIGDLPKDVMDKFDVYNGEFTTGALIIRDTRRSTLHSKICAKMGIPHEILQMVVENNHHLFECVYYSVKDAARRLYDLLKEPNAKVF